MKKRRSFTLLEILIALFLMGCLLTSLFSSFFQIAKKSVQNRELKQSFLGLTVFEQKIKHLLTRTKKVWVTTSPEAVGSVLCVQFVSDADVEWDRIADVQGMLYLNEKEQLYFVTWDSKGERPRAELLFEKMDAFTCRFFDEEKKVWVEQWQEKEKGLPSIISLELSWEGNKIPFTFFPFREVEPISYLGVP